MRKPTGEVIALSFLHLVIVIIIIRVGEPVGQSVEVNLTHASWKESGEWKVDEVGGGFCNLQVRGGDKQLATEESCMCRPYYIFLVSEGRV